MTVKPSSDGMGEENYFPERRNVLLKTERLTKKFGDFTANEDVSFSICTNEIHALLGENGAGKSTFVKMIYGLLQPDKGHIEWKGSRIIIEGPQHARKLGIGMVFQHFSLFQALTVVENIQLALPYKQSLSSLSKQIKIISEEYGIGVKPSTRVFNLSIGEQQRVEILRCLLQNPSLLIMDEPTSVLTPQEAKQMFKVLKRFSELGGSILFISHKLSEVLTLAERATVLRRGKKIDTIYTEKKSTKQLAEMMVGEKIASPSSSLLCTSGKIVFEIKNLSRPQETHFSTSLKHINIQARSGEVLGIAGVAGNGQDELMEAMIGEWKSPKDGVFFCEEKDFGRTGPSSRRNLGLAFVPEERNGHGAVPTMSLSENNFLTCHSQKGALKNGLINSSKMMFEAKKISAAFDIRLPYENPIASSLSGGNLQKFVVGREIQKNPKVLIVAQPTWGLDVGAAMFIRSAIIKLAQRGSAVIIISQDLEEIFLMSQRVSVIYSGTLSKAVETNNVTADEIGRLMAGINVEIKN